MIRVSMIISALILGGSSVTASTLVGNESAPFEDALSGLRARVEAGTYGTVTSVLIVKNGNVVLEEYFNGADATTTHNVRSASKSVTGMLVGAAIDDGLISGVNARAAQFFSDLQPFDNPDPRKSAITIKNLLTMTSVLECNDFNQFSRGNEERLYLVEDWSAFYWNLPIRNLPSWEQPDDYDGKPTFSYCTAGVQLVGEIVERVTRKSAQDYADEKLFKPLGITSSKWGIASSGQAHLGGGLELTTQDWGKLGELSLGKGRYKGKRIISRKWFEDSFKEYATVQQGYTYGYLWWLQSYEVAGKSHGAKIMSGSGGNRIYVLPDHNVTLVITKTDFNLGMRAHGQAEALFENEVVGNAGLMATTRR